MTLPADMHEVERGFAAIIALHAQGSYAEALERTEALLARYPGCARLWLIRGKLLQLVDEEPVPVDALDQIAHSLQRAQVLATRDAEIDIELGYWHYAVKDDVATGARHFTAAEEKALAQLREALVGQLRCALELDDAALIARLHQRLVLLFPDDVDLDLLLAELGVPREPDQAASDQAR